MIAEIDSIALIASADKTLSLSKSSYRLFRKLLATTGGELDDSNSTVILQAVEQLSYRNYPWSVSVRSIIEVLQDQQLEFERFGRVAG
ncbi:unnamed protein product [marine sediment metagenome]|uniref:Uncharacterized protein n=1 Tax=marine sediment metagenome TaxID=412755 RepID=X1KVR1_9ZZZZ